jgi:hypothetical protein
MSVRTDLREMVGEMELRRHHLHAHPESCLCGNTQHS